ncbi:MAG: hypothetical protein EAZ91_19585 [Cytophagales bacterium]|nr:MAG: hypothetical protein EAZ91_19585 [Cytophagales bacterium]
MSELTITVENAEDEALLLSLAKRLNAQVRQRPVLPPRSNAQAMVNALDKIGASGTFDYIPDPQIWQRDIRQDRPHPFSE